MTEKPSVIKIAHPAPLTGPTIFITPWQYGVNHTADRVVLGWSMTVVTAQGNIKTVVD